MARARVRLGEVGEDLAVRELERRGYAVLARRYRRRSGEIDIIAADGRTVVFVEVKTRDGEVYGSAAAAVTALKQRRLIATARDYLSRQHLVDVPCRFDVVAVCVTGAGPEPEVEVFQNAFQLSG
jgi:putative endonuclease